MHNKKQYPYLPRRILSAILIVFVLFSTNIITLDAKAIEATPNKVPIIVSLGDSYSSGEGIEPFYGQNKSTKEKIKDEDWLAHRSEKSWGGMLSLPSVSGTMADHRNENWFFVASSGAITKNIYTEKQSKPYCHKKLVNIEPLLPLQHDIFSEIDKNVGENEIDYVTMTIGGNDADFTGIVTAAAMDIPYLKPSSIYETVTKKLKETEKDGEIYNNLKTAYADICEKAGKQAKVIVAGYPKLLDPKGSGFFFGEYDATILNIAATEFNKSIERLVDTCRNEEEMNIHFVSVEEAFEGHGAYSNEPYINPVWTPKSEDLVDLSYYSLKLSGNENVPELDKIDPPLTSSYSMHPNYKGACTYAACVQAKINELENTSTETINYSKETTYSKNLNISVLNYNLKACENYKISIKGTKSGFLGLNKKDYADEINVNKATTTQLTLPEGTYTITVTDGLSSYSKKVKISSYSSNSDLKFYTIFGYEIPKELTNQEQSNNSSTEENMKLAGTYWRFTYGPTNGGLYQVRFEENDEILVYHIGSDTFSNGKYSYSNNKLYIELDSYADYFNKISDNKFKALMPVHIANGNMTYYYEATRIADTESIKNFEKKAESWMNKSKTDEAAIFYQYIKDNLTLCKAYPSDIENEKGVVSALIEDFDNNGNKELVTFSITHNTADQPEIILNLYIIENNTVVLADTSTEIFISGGGYYQNMTCATFENSLIKIQTEQCNSGGSSFVSKYRTFAVSNNKLVLKNEYSRSEFARYEKFTYEETVSGTTFSSWEEFYSAVDNAGYDRQNHKHVGYTDSEFDATKDNYLTAECFRGNHIFVAFSSLEFFLPGEYSFIYDNTNLLQSVQNNNYNHYKNLIGESKENMLKNYPSAKFLASWSGCDIYDIGSNRRAYITDEGKVGSFYVSVSDVFPDVTSAMSEKDFEALTGINWSVSPYEVPLEMYKDVSGYILWSDDYNINIICDSNGSISGANARCQIT